MRSCIILLLQAAMLVACQGASQNQGGTTGVSDLGIPDRTVKDYLASQMIRPSFGGQVFCAYELMDTESTSNTVTLYLWALCEEFYCSQQQVAQGSGISLPVAILGRRQADGSWSLDHRIAQDGPGYDQEIRTIFPRRVWQQITPGSSEEVADFNRRSSTLESDVVADATARLDGCRQQ